MRDLVDELLHAKVKAQLFGGDHAPRLGRLIILERIGSGAMGDVFSAHDPRLDRKVAIKLVRPTAGVPAERVLAEARALAKLAHPNVVAIYDADEIDGAIAIVMELAAGISLRTWLATDRDWNDIARVLREAATGLAAAHAAGLVHRDIKPDNILVGDDRTRVVDFGLAFANAASSADEALSGAGTPTYMAPEVLGGAPATPASDQFSFGVTLFEALYGVRPHTGTSREELRIAALSAALAETMPSSSRASTTTAISSLPALTRRSAPAWLHAIAVRALAGDPRDRFSSMADFAAALGRDRRRRRWIAASIGVALVAAGASAFIATRVRSDTGDPCGGADARLANVWSVARANEVRARLGNPGDAVRPAGEQGWVPVAIAALDERSAAWTKSYRNVCEATRVRGEQSDTLLDLRMRCLDRALDRFDALAIQLAKPLDARTRVEATSAIGELPVASACETLVDAGELALPADFAGRKRALAARHDIARAWAAFSLSHYGDARAIGERIERDIAGLDAAGVIAELAAVRAAVEARIGTAATAKPALDRALVAASRANAAELESRVWAMRLRQELFAGDPKHVEDLLPLARAAAARAHLDGGEIDGIAGEAERDAGDLEKALVLLQRAWASKDPLRSDQRAVIAMNLGAVHLTAGNFAKAEGAFVRAYELAARMLGANHPSLALYLDKLAALDRARGQVRAALARNKVSVEMRTIAYGENDRAVATSLLGRARTYLEMGDVAAAKADALRAHAIRTAVFGADSARLGDVEAVLGDIEAAAGHLDAARAHYRKTAAIDPRVSLIARVWAVDGALAVLDVSVTHYDPSNTSSIVRTAAALEAEIAGMRSLFATDGLTMLVDSFEALPTPTDPAVPYAIALLATKVNDPRARVLLDAAFATLPDEPTRTRLRLASLRAKIDPEDRELADRARALHEAMPQLALESATLPGPDAD